MPRFVAHIVQNADLFTQMNGVEMFFKLERCLLNVLDKNGIYKQRDSGSLFIFACDRLKRNRPV